MGDEKKVEQIVKDAEQKSLDTTADRNKITTNIDDLTKLQKEVDDFEKDKNKLAKEVLEQKQKEIDAKKVEIDKKKKETEELIAKIRKEWLDLKLENLDDTTKQSILDKKTEEEKLLSQYETKLKSFNNPQAKPEEKGWLGKTTEWIGDKWNGLSVPGRWAVVGAGVLAVGWIAGLFNRKKKKKKSEEGDGDEGMSRWKKALLWGGGIAGGLMIWKHRDSITDRFKGLFGLKKPDDTTEHNYENLTNLDSMDKEFETSARKADYNLFGEKVNDFYANMYGAGGMSGPDLLGEKDGDKQLEKNVGTIPYVLDKQYSTVGDILSESAFFDEKNMEKEGQLTQYFMDKFPNFLGSILHPFISTFTWLTQSMFQTDANGKLLLTQEGKDALKAHSNDTEAVFKSVMRKFTKVRVYLEDKEDQLRRLLTKKKLESLGEIKAGMTVQDIDELIDDKLDDTDFQEQYIDDTMKYDFLDKKIISEVNEPGVFETLKDNDILDGNLGKETTEEVVRVDKTKAGIVGSTLTDVLSGTADLNSASIKENLSNLCGDMKREINSEFVREAFLTRKLGIFAHMFNMEGIAKEDLLKMFGYHELTGMYITQITDFEKKLAAGTVTKDDVQNLQLTIDQFFMLEKEITTGVGMMVDVKEENGSIVARLQTTSGLAVNRFIQLDTAGKIIVAGIAIGLCYGPTRRLMRGATKTLGYHLVLRPAGWIAGKTAQELSKNFRRGFRSTPILKEFNRLYFKGNDGPELLMQAVKRREITLTQAAEIAKRRSSSFFSSETTKLRRQKIGRPDIVDTKIAILKQIDKNADDLFKNIPQSERKLMANNFDNKPWTRLFAEGTTSVKLEALTVLKQYSESTSRLKQSGKLRNIDLLEFCLSHRRFNELDNIKKLLSYIEDVDLQQSLDKKMLASLAKKIGDNIHNIISAADITKIMTDAGINITPSAKTIDLFKDIDPALAKEKVAFSVYERRKVNLDDLTKEFQPGGKLEAYAAEFEAEYKKAGANLTDLDWKLAERMITKEDDFAKGILEQAYKKEIDVITNQLDEDLRLLKGYSTGATGKTAEAFDKQIAHLEDTKKMVSNLAPDEIEAFKRLYGYLSGKNANVASNISELWKAARKNATLLEALNEGNVTKLRELKLDARFDKLITDEVLHVFEDAGLKKVARVFFSEGAVTIEKVCAKLFAKIM